MKLTIDFETKSDISLKDHGAWLYSIHPSTHATTISWSDGILEDGQWREGDSRPIALFSLTAEADIVEAHNSQFEDWIWANVCVKKYGWPAIESHKWRCSAAKAAACGLPRALGDAGKAIQAPTIKDEKEGKWAMQKIARNAKNVTEDDWKKMLTYNRNDVASEESLSGMLPDLPPRELAIWRVDRKMNARGFTVDVAGCRKAVMLAGAYARVLTDKFKVITGLETAGQRAKFAMWMAKKGYTIENTQADTLDKLLRGNIADADVHTAIETVRALGRSSIKKYRACLDMAGPDHRARGCFLYHGAGTGRWSGRGLQPQNFKRECRWDMDKAWEDIHAHDLETIEMLYGDPLTFLSETTRGAIIATPGTRFLVGDYAQIEARMVFWFAGERFGLDAFRRGDDIYMNMAELIWGRKLNKKIDSEKRFVGKHAILGLGFGAGYVKFLMHLRELHAPAFSWKQVCEIVPAGWRSATLRWILNEGWNNVKRRMPEATEADARELVLTKYVTDKYRKTYASVVKLWNAAEDAAANAMRNPGKTFTVNGKFSYTRGEKFLNCRLPSGRIMRYHDPKIDDAGKISYRNTNDIWVSTYGGKLVENVVQASARDVMAEAMLRLDATDEYQDIVMTIHDELIVESSFGTLDDYIDIMAEPPLWCGDLPIKVDGWEGARYKKA